VVEPRPRGIAHSIGAHLPSHPVWAFLLTTLAGFVLLSAVAIGAGLLLMDVILPYHGIGGDDEQVNTWLAAHRSGLGNTISNVLSGIGDVYAIPGLVVLTTLILLIRRKWRAAAFVVTAIAVEAATYRVTTLFINRERPEVPRLDNLPPQDSFYSGHVAASVAVYCGIALLITSRFRSRAVRWPVWAIALTVPVLVAISRLYRGMHHPTDAVAGLLVGIGALAVAIVAARAAGAAYDARRAR
jgi:membrane-associated phospholipid phosphatase